MDCLQGAYSTPQRNVRSFSKAVWKQYSRQDKEMPTGICGIPGCNETKIIELPLKQGIFLN